MTLLRPADEIGGTTSPARQVQREPLEHVARFLTAVLSLAAAAIHVGVIGEHWSEWRLAGVFFAVLAVAQIGWAFAVLRGRSRLVLALGAVGQLYVVLLWLVSRSAGLPFGPEAGEPEAAGFADVLCSVLELLAAGGAVVVLLPRVAGRLIPTRRAGAATNAGTLLVAGLTVVSFLPFAGHEHVHVTGDIPAGWTAGCMHHHSGGGHAAGACTNASVTAAERAAAEQLVAATTANVPSRYPTLAAAEAAGYRPYNVDDSIVHVVRPDYLTDGRVLDPARVESLVYVVNHGRSLLMGAMYINEPASAPGPLIGGALTSWHLHTNLCLDATGSTAFDAVHGHCAAGSRIAPTPQMLHVWTRPYRGGPFADLDAAGAKRALEALRQLN